MKKKDLDKLFQQNGWWIKRQGGSHEIWTNGTEQEQVPRHREINERLAQAIIKKRGLK